MLFSVCGNVAAAGWLIVPDGIPARVRAAAAGLCVFTWLLAQWLLRRQDAYLRDIAARVEVLLTVARQSLDQADPADARDALRHAIMLDPEHLEAHVLAARLASREGDPAEVRRSWRVVSQLDRADRYADEAGRAQSADRLRPAESSPPAAPD